MPKRPSSDGTARRRAAHHHGKEHFHTKGLQSGFGDLTEGSCLGRLSQPTATQRLTPAVPSAVPRAGSTEAAPSPSEPKGATALHQEFIGNEEQLGLEWTKHTCAPATAGTPLGKAGEGDGKREIDGKLRPERAIRAGSAAANCGGREFLGVGEPDLYTCTGLEVSQTKQCNGAAVYREKN